jgi:hypothetical protein
MKARDYLECIFGLVLVCVVSFGLVFLGILVN